jgi:hypothetical protein
MHMKKLRVRCHLKLSNSESGRDIAALYLFTGLKTTDSFHATVQLIKVRVLFSAFYPVSNLCFTAGIKNGRSELSRRARTAKN